MEKQSSVEANHEVWVICAACGCEFDRRAGDTCPECGEKYETK